MIFPRIHYHVLLNIMLIRVANCFLKNQVGQFFETKPILCGIGCRAATASACQFRLMKMTSLALEIPSIEDMEDLGALMSSVVLQEDPEGGHGAILFLDGDLGAGKSTFSRGFIRQATADYSQRVTSPTFLLSNTYPVAGKDLE